ncbi:polysaccharide deacetylase family protein [Corynebacterium ureicelerivorans]|uniref:polysaccharide deacetylase family protein n=1 Tax=Corynebacterium ureicelerivorans TaxID=401472 RepID=UPI002651195F|nr:polysaccharide deacetylase family protein [Corynebacterium ureicelerivorans]MDN8605793.1 polysaccharide deacetylase family protein [Corynebacterium ureicelerivorans]
MKRLCVAVSSALALVAAAGAPSAASTDVAKVTQLATPNGAQVIPGHPFGPILAEGEGLPIDASSAFVAKSSQRTSWIADDGWRRAYASLPAQAQQAVPPHLRPTDLGTPAAVTVEPVQEPSPAPEPAKYFNCVALTYDDGPVPGTTERLLDTLKRKGVHATFFVVGQNANAYPEILRRIRDEGHTIGNHSYSHPDMARQTDGTIAAQLDKTDAALAEQGGITPRWMRPPYGSYDSRVAAAAGARGMALAVWDVDTADWQHRNTATTCQRAVAGAHEGSVILMHDIHEPTVAAAECVIDGLRAKGLKPVGLDEMMKRPDTGHVYRRAD